mmetsp:Transcript_3153/g.10630  ORF Transcript_3153/g.10630 Transcript_3153/m.10630 type:complete len:98 (+) Transcript_3153:149-442(+)
MKPREIGRSVCLSKVSTLKVFFLFNAKSKASEGFPGPSSSSAIASQVGVSASSSHLEAAANAEDPWGAGAASSSCTAEPARPARTWGLSAVLSRGPE